MIYLAVDIDVNKQMTVIITSNQSHEVNILYQLGADLLKRPYFTHYFNRFCAYVGFRDEIIWLLNTIV